MRLTSLSVLLPLIFCYTTLLGQNYDKDSLRQVLLQSDDPDSMFEIGTMLFNSYYTVNLDSAESYFHLIQNLSQKENKKEWQLTVHLLASRLLWKRGQYDSVLFHTIAYNSLAEDLDENVKYIEGLKRLSTLYDAMGRMDTSLVIAKVAYEKARHISDWNAISKIQLRLGNLFYRMAEYDQALIYYQKVDSTLKRNGEINEELASALSNIGLIYTYLKNPEALDYFDQCKKIYQQLDHPEGVIYAETSKAVYYADVEKYDKAIPLYRKSYEFYTNYGDLRELASRAIQLGDCYLNINNQDSAIFFYERSSQLAEKLEAPSLLGQSQTSLGFLYYKLREYDQSIHHYQKALENYQKVGLEFTIEERANIHKGLYQSYRAKPDHQSAYAALDNYLSLNDSVTQKQNNELTQELEAKYQTEKKEQQIDLLTTQNQLAAQQKRNQLLLFGSIASVLFVLSIFLFILYRDRQRTNKKLKELDTAKSNFFTNISHEFRTPLTLIKAPAKDQLEEKHLSEVEKRRMEMIDRNSDRLLALVDQVLDLAKLDARSLQLKVTEYSIPALIKALITSYEYVASQKNLDFQSTLSPSLGKGWFDPDVLEKILSNLLSNAIKYTPDHGTIELFLSEENGAAKLIVKNSTDKNFALDPELAFTRFYRDNQHEQGIGIGLALVKELTELHHGTVQLHQEAHSISFEVQFPITREAYRKEEINATPDAGSVNRGSINAPAADTSSNLIGTENIDQNEPVLLIVEDNRELAQLIHDQFKDQYQVLVSHDGEEGIEKAIKYVPDLIISDIMMPRKDGVELAQTLKTDELTSHIPIILLTAKADDSDRLKGIETGADDYITKPFNKEILSTRIQRLIEERAKLRKKYSQEVVLHPKEMAITSTDEKFLLKLQEIIDHRLTDSEFGAETFSKEMGMSRMQLHRKLKALLGVSTSEFIRSERLKMAASLLRHSQVNISEVGYAVGFNDASYFTKCFREVHGCVPKQYAEEMNDKS